VDLTRYVPGTSTVWSLLQVRFVPEEGNSHFLVLFRLTDYAIGRSHELKTTQGQAVRLFNSLDSCVIYPYLLRYIDQVQITWQIFVAFGKPGIQCFTRPPQTALLTFSHPEYHFIEVRDYEPRVEFESHLNWASGID
jgi:hypothetical protein